MRAIKESVKITNPDVLLAGENSCAKKIYAKILNTPAEKIVIAGLDNTSDFEWNFENPPPKNLDNYDIVISYAILEHLINPYGHIVDLFSLLTNNGLLAVFTEMPNFHYHRHPIDTLRFFPDWFYEVAKRNNVEVLNMLVSDDHIVTIFHKSIDI